MVGLRITTIYYTPFPTMSIGKIYFFKKIVLFHYLWLKYYIFLENKKENKSPHYKSLNTLYRLFNAFPNVFLVVAIFILWYLLPLLPKINPSSNHKLHLYVIISFNSLSLMLYALKSIHTKYVASISITFNFGKFLDIYSFTKLMLLHKYSFNSSRYSSPLLNNISLATKPNVGNCEYPTLSNSFKNLS